MKKHKQYISEWKSVNDNVKDLAEKISKQLWDISHNDKPYVSELIDCPYIEGSFEYGVNPDAFGFDVLTVNYTIYFFDSAKEYNETIDKIGNSESDYETRSITIRNGFIEGYFNYLILQDVYHEIEHLFSYANGMEKRENFYNTVKECLERYKNNVEYCSVAKLTYYTFRHEQDAFANQFYGFLNKEHVNMDFKNAVSYMPHYVDYKRQRAIFLEFLRYKPDECIACIKELGMTLEQFKKRIHFGFQRFEKKLRNVYERHMIEIRESARTIMMKKIILEEYRKRYKNIEFKRENYL